MQLLLVSFVLLVGASCIAARSGNRDKLFLLKHPDSDNDHTLLVIEWSGEGNEVDRCVTFTDQDLISEVLKASKDQVAVHHPTAEEMQEVLSECSVYSSRRRRRSAEENDYDYDDEEAMAAPTATEDSSSWNIIFPYTKWCGAGDKAKDYDDLGLHQDTDRCCRAHDLCDDLILAGETKYNLTNKSPFTKLSCQCDNDFYNCLSRINTVTSNTIGNSYFNVLKRPCFAKGYPLTNKCKKYRSFLKITCKEYARDTNAPQVYQWFRAKIYKQLPIPGPLNINIPFTGRSE